MPKKKKAKKKPTKKKTANNKTSITATERSKLADQLEALISDLELGLTFHVGRNADAIWDEVRELSDRLCGRTRDRQGHLLPAVSLAPIFPSRVAGMHMSIEYDENGEEEGVVERPVLRPLWNGTIATIEGEVRVENDLSPAERKEDQLLDSIEKVLHNVVARSCPNLASKYEEPTESPDESVLIARLSIFVARLRGKKTKKSVKTTADPPEDRSGQRWSRWLSKAEIGRRRRAGSRSTDDDIKEWEDKGWVERKSRQSLRVRLDKLPDNDREALEDPPSENKVI